MIVEVAVLLPVDDTYDYALPAGASAEPGCRVIVPYGGRELTGVVVAVHAAPRPERSELRQVSQVVDRTPVLPAPLVEVLLRAARYSLSPPGLALGAAIPAGTTPRPGRSVVLQDAGRRALESDEVPRALRPALRALERGPLPEARFRARFAAAAGALERLERIGWLRRSASTEQARVRARTRPVYALAPGQDLATWRARAARAPARLRVLDALAAGPQLLPPSAPLRALVEAGAVVCEEREVERSVEAAPLIAQGAIPEPTPHQAGAVAEIGEALRAGRAETFLLYGITGSGKTEVYLRAAQLALAQGRGAIVLVPEISLTHQVVDRFRARFADRVAVLHSGLSAGERFDQWRSIREGAHSIAIGARSAVFAPFERPGLIVIDEEHDPAYKSEDGFHYHARDVAELRAAAAGCPLVLGSATPDVATMFRSERGEIRRLELPERVASRPLPRVQIVDMEQERRARGRFQILSRALRDALNETLVARQQAILFVNRRGFANFVYCFDCGHSLRCKHCDITLVYHASAGARRRDVAEEGELHCHYCGYREDPEPRCPSCGSPDGALLGFGTERLQEQVSAMFPHARVDRLDRDTSARKGAQREILARFHRAETDVLVGTQMVAKGHDVPGVTLVGVVAADLGLHFPDYRAGERTFQLLTQVAGRAGRGSDPGRVVIQSYLPDHYAIALARTHDYPAFFREELARRRPHGYPPFRDLLQVGLAGREAEAVSSAARELAELARAEAARGGDLEVLGPAPAPLARIRDEFRWQLLVLGSPERIRAAARLLVRRGAGLAGVTVRVVPGPVQML